MANLDKIKKLQNSIKQKNDKMGDWVLYDEWLKKVDKESMNPWQWLRHWSMDVAFSNRVKNKTQKKELEEAELKQRIEEEKIKTDVDMNEDLTKPMREVRLNKLLEEQKSIQDGIDSARQSMQESARTKGFKARITGFFSAFTYTMREGMNREKLIEISRKIEFEKEEIKRIEERSRKKVQPEKQKDKGAEKGDLEYHQYEGRGLEARHHSEVYDPEKTELEKGSLQENVLARVNEDLDREGQELLQRKAEMDREDAATITQYMSLISGKTEWELNRMGEKEHNQLRERAVKYRDQSVEVRGQLEWSTNMLKNLEQLDKADKNRISYLERDEKASKKLIENKNKEIHKLDSKIESQRLKLKEQEIARDNAKKEFEEKQNSYKKLDKLTYKQFRELRGLQAAMESTSSAYDKANRKFTKLEEQQEGLRVDVKSLKERIEDGIKEREDLKKARKEREVKMEPVRSVNQNLKKLDDAEVKISNTLLQRTLQRQKERQELELKIAQNQKAKENAKHDVLNADVSSFLVDNSIHDTVHGIAVNGKVYLDQKEAQEKGITDVENKLNEKEKKRLIETQKIVNALKSRPFFKILNSETISEYLTYDENKADFELLGPNATEQEKKKFELDMRKKYFQTDAIFTNHQIKVNSYWAANNARDMNMDYYKQFIKETMLQTGGAFVGTDSFVPVASDGKYDFWAGDDKKLTGVSDSKKANQVVGGVLPLASTAAMGVDFGLSIAKANDVLFQNGDCPISTAGFVSSAMTLAQQIHTIATAKSEKAEQKAQKEADLKKGLTRFANMMSGAMAQNSRKIVEASTEISKILAKNALVYGHGWGTIAGIATTIITTGVSIGLKKLISSHIVGKTDKEMINSPDVLGGIDYDKKVISDTDFNQILASVTGIGSKNKLVRAMRIMDGIDLHRSAQKSLKKSNVEVDKHMAALGFGDKRKYNKVSVENILKKTSAIKEKWRDTLKATIEARGVDFDDASTLKGKAKKGIHAYADKARRSREAHTFYKQHEIVKQQEKLETVQGGKESAINVASKEIAKKLYDAHITRMKLDEKSGKSVNLQGFANPENRQKLILLMAKTNTVQSLAFHGVGSINEKDLTQLAGQAMQEASELANHTNKAGKQNPENVVGQSKDYEIGQGIELEG